MRISVVAAQRFLYLIICLLFLSFNSGIAQTVIIEEDFEDGDFTENPEWVGDTENWIIVEEDGNNVLRLNASEAGESQLSTLSPVNYGEWEFSVRLDGFTTSNTNRAHVFLISDRANTSDSPSGYAVRIGESGSDKFFRIVRFDNGTGNNVIVTGETLIEQNIWYNVRVVRDTSGEWSLFVGTDEDADPLPEGSPAIDNTYANAEWFSLRPTYTATRVDRFFFDNIRVIKYPLFLALIDVVDNSTFDLVFSEAIEPESIDDAFFELITPNGTAFPQSAALEEDNRVRLSFADSFQGGSYEMVVEGVRDLTGTPMEPIVFPFDIIDQAEFGDIIINEFFYNEPGNFPQYVELLNASEKLINLNTWRIQDNSSTIRRLTTSDYFLSPGEYVVLTGNAAGLGQRFGDRNYLELGNFPSLNRASADQIKIFTENEVLIDSLRYDPNTWGGENAALERRSADAISYAQENWEESADPLGGTPGLPNTTTPDPDPIELVSVSYSGASNLVLQFDRHADRSTAKEIQNYSLSGGIGISEAQKIAFNEVILTLGSDMQPNTNYSISVENVESIFGVPMPEQSLSFTFFVIEDSETGDVVINEFMYNTAPGFSRYIELYNRSDKALDLQGWTSNNDTGNRRIITDSSYLLPPGEFVVLAPDNSLLDFFADVPLIDMGSRFSALKLGGDDIVIRNQDGVLIDSLRYVPSWGGSEVALERRDTEVSGIYRENWGDSPAQNLGTPGLPNEIPPDTSPPEFISVVAADQENITLQFSKSMDRELAENPDNYGINPFIPVASITADKELVFITFSEPLTADLSYSLGISGLTDIFGNSLEPVSTSFTFLEFEEAQPGDIIVNEFLYRQLSGEIPRFIELYNRSDRNINLHEWELGRSISSIQLSGSGGVLGLPPNGYLVITDRPDLLGSEPAQTLSVQSMLALSQNGDSIFLRNTNGTLVDSLRYSPDWGGSPAGFSLERLDPEAASNDKTNWRTHPSGNSAGEINANFEPNTLPPDVIFSRQTDDGFLEVRFSEFISTTDQTIFRLNQQPLEIASFNPFAGDRIFLQPQNGGSGALNFGDEDDLIHISNISDVPGNIAETLQIPVARSILPGDVIINEIMFQPISDSRNPFPDQSEYVEFHNRQNYAISLEGFFIHDEPDRDGNISRIIPVTTESGFIPANGYAVLYADPAPEFNESRIAQFFEISAENERQFFRADRNTLSFNNTADSIFLARADSTVIDSVFYEAAWHNPNLPDTRGIALERINPFGESNLAENWGSNVLSRGGTPGAPNSLFQQPGGLPATESITLEPNPFSPNSDGQNDNLFINYTLNQADYLLRVRIFDRYGRLVRTLADGRPAGLNGTLTWNGRRDNGMENRIGIYIVVFEAYNSSGGRNRTFRESVVLARPL
ncbi:MAG: lamin tail domain-containing protein [Balneolales bacterium]|nr:lamin tail domain-containing protein [Balneolales bacterium]